MKILDKINSSDDIKKLSLKELNCLADEIRTFLIENVSKTGGHLASNLGTVELTLALNRVFDPKTDRIVWDVGHQAYTHKIINGRKNKFSTLRQEGGISGFPKTAESITDAFETGHSSTSVSAALGFAAANRLCGGKAHSIAVIGDGAFTGGLAFEGINNAAEQKLPLIVILNDNGMAISKNIGGISKYLQKVRNDTAYFKIKTFLRNRLDSSPKLGRKIVNFTRGIRDIVKKLTLDKELFENLGLKYYGPVDGHDIKSLISVLTYAKTKSEPLLIHVKTVKGKGYSLAEKKPDDFHGVGCFDPETGEAITKNNALSYSALFGREIIKQGEKNKKLVCITAAMPQGTGLCGFAQKFPPRFFDCGIAEEHSVTFAAALAASGLIPVFAVYSTFLQRAYDQILHDAALTGRHIVLCIDRAGIVGRDGETHQGVYDLSYLSHIPNMVIMAPSGRTQFAEMLDFALNVCRCPVAIRYPRADAKDFYKPAAPLELGMAETVKDGSEVLIVSIGTVIAEALGAAKLLEKKNISAAVVDARFLKPFDSETVEKYAKKAKVVVSVEDNVLSGGLSEAVCKAAKKEVICFGLKDEPITQGSIEQIKKRYGITAKNIAKIIEEKLEQEN